MHSIAHHYVLTIVVIKLIVIRGWNEREKIETIMMLKKSTKNVKMSKIGKKVKDEQNRKWSKIVGKILKIL